MLIREVRRGCPGDPALFHHGCSTTRAAREFSNASPNYRSITRRAQSEASWRAFAMKSSPPPAVAIQRLSALSSWEPALLRRPPSCSMLPRDCRVKCSTHRWMLSSDALDVACDTIGNSLPGVCISPIVAKLCNRSAPARIVQRNYVGVIHRFKHWQLRTRRGTDDSSQSQRPVAIW